jgi:hypothetical protein
MLYEDHRSWASEIFTKRFSGKNLLFVPDCWLKTAINISSAPVFLKTRTVICGLPGCSVHRKLKAGFRIPVSHKNYGSCSSLHYFSLLAELLLSHQLTIIPFNDKKIKKFN